MEKWKHGTLTTSSWWLAGEILIKTNFSPLLMWHPRPLQPRCRRLGKRPSQITNLNVLCMQELVKILAEITERNVPKKIWVILPKRAPFCDIALKIAKIALLNA